MLNYAAWPPEPKHEKWVREVRAFVDGEAKPLLSAAYDRGEFPRELIPSLGRLGAFGASVEGDWSPLDAMTFGLLCQELERGDSGLRTFVSAQSSLVMFPIASFGSRAQQRRYLPGLRAGEIIGCFALTEPAHGSDLRSMETVAVGDGATGEYVLNGTKRWITNGPIAHMALVWARLNDGDETHVRGFLVEADRPGISVIRIEDKLSLRISQEAEIVLEDCRVPRSAILPRAVGMRAALSCLTEARFGVAFGVVGAAMACFEEAVAYSGAREQWGRPIAGFQLTQQKLVDALQGITQGQLLAYQLARLKDAGTLRHQQVSLAKRASCSMALAVARDTRSILGETALRSATRSCAIS